MIEFNPRIGLVTPKVKFLCTKINYPHLDLKNWFYQNWFWIIIVLSHRRLSVQYHLITSNDRSQTDCRHYWSSFFCSYCKYYTIFVISMMDNICDFVSLEWFYLNVSIEAMKLFKWYLIMNKRTLKQDTFLSWWIENYKCIFWVVSSLISVLMMIIQGISIRHIQSI